MKATQNCRNCQADPKIHTEMKSKIAKTILKKRIQLES